MVFRRETLSFLGEFSSIATQNPFSAYVDSISAKRAVVKCKMCRHLYRPLRVVKCNFDDDDDDDEGCVRGRDRGCHTLPHFC